MDLDSDTLRLNGDVEIQQDSGATLNSKNLFINHGLVEKKYDSSEKTVYRSNDNIVNSDKGFDIRGNPGQTGLTS